MASPISTRGTETASVDGRVAGTAFPRNLQTEYGMRAETWSLALGGASDQPLPGIPEEITAAIDSRRGAIDLVASRDAHPLHIHPDDEGPVPFHGCIQSPAGGGETVELLCPKAGSVDFQFDGPDIAFEPVLIGHRIDRGHRQRPGPNSKFQ